MRVIVKGAPIRLQIHRISEANAVDALPGKFPAATGTEAIKVT